MRTLVYVALVVGAMTPALLAQDAPGFYVETRVTTVSRGGSGNTTIWARVERAWMSAKCSRFEGERYRGDTAAYRLVFGSPPRVLYVLPRDRVVHTFDSVGARFAARALAMQRASSQPRVRSTALGAGEVILGHRTHKYQFESTTRSDAGSAEVAPAPSVTTQWVAEDPSDPLVAAYRAARASLLGGERVGNVRGIVLRSETRNRSWRDVSQVATKEVLVWRRENLPASHCVIPDGYRTVGASAEMRALDAATEELRRLSRSENPADRARAKALGDSLFKEVRGTLPTQRPLREDPRAVIIDGKATKKP